ncbi:MAG: DUF1080 domain-containing protein [Bacteroidota bacterium]|nr:DUF1080 domain-containing protein [Bacteroidota bacterium]
MKIRNIFGALLMIALCGNSMLTMAQENSPEPFLGMWALTLGYEDNSAGWLEVRQEKEYLDADLLWRWGSVLPVEFTMVSEGQLFLVQGRDVVKKVEGKPDRKLHPIQWFMVSKTGEDQIEGVASFPNRDGVGVEMVSFTGKRIPPEGEAPKLKKSMFGDPVELFNGKDLDNWVLADKGAVSGWKAVDGVMVNNPEQKKGETHIHYGNLRTKDSFEDFNLKLEVIVPKGSNSGVYLRGIYEVQVMDSYGKELDSHNMGALYSRITPSEAAEKPAGEWQKMDITLYKRYLTVKLNGKTIIDNQPVKGVTGGALTSDQFSPGPILLQGDHGKVSYRNIVLTPIL